MRSITGQCLELLSVCLLSLPPPLEKNSLIGPRVACRTRPRTPMVGWRDYVEYSRPVLFGPRKRPSFLLRKLHYSTEPKQLLDGQGLRFTRNTVWKHVTLGTRFCGPSPYTPSSSHFPSARFPSVTSYGKVCPIPKTSMALFFRVVFF